MAWLQIRNVWDKQLVLFGGKKKHHTPWKFNTAPEILPFQKERIIFQPLFFRGELLNFGSVSMQKNSKESRHQPAAPAPIIWWILVKKLLKMQT